MTDRPTDTIFTYSVFISEKSRWSLYCSVGLWKDILRFRINRILGWFRGCRYIYQWDKRNVHACIHIISNNKHE